MLPGGSEFGGHSLALSRPTLAALYARVQADFVALSQTGGAILRQSVEWALARIIAVIAHGLYAYQDDRVRQAFPDTADEPGVRRWGGLFRVPENPATSAAGPLVFTGSGTTSIPAGTEVRIGSWLYTTDTTGAISGGTATRAATATLVGSGGNAPVSATGSLTNPIAGIDSTVTVGSGGLIGGTDAEQLEPYRTRVLNRMANPPRGGTEADYEAWISETPSVDMFRCWVYPAGDGVGTMAAAFVLTDDGPTGFALAESGDVSAVQAYVDSKRPADMRSFRAYTPTGEALALTIDLTLQPGAVLATVRAAVQASLDALLGAESEPETALPLSRIGEAISTTAGEYKHVIDLPASDPTPATGAMFTSVAITWS